MEDGKKMINVLYEDNHIIVVMKPANVPVCEDSSGDLDLLSMVKHYLEEKYNKKAKMHTQIALFAYSLSFLHPTLKKELVFSVDIPKIYPYNF